MASGSEVSLIVKQAGKAGRTIHKSPRLVSLPLLGTIRGPRPGYRARVLPVDNKSQTCGGSRRLDGLGTLGRRKGRILAIDRFGASAPAETVFTELA